MFVFNSQNSTPDVTAVVAKAKQAGIPVAAVTETLTLKGASFQDWQANQLQSLADALATATGRALSSASAAQASTPAPSTATAAAPATGAHDAPAAPVTALARTGSSPRGRMFLAAASVLGGLVMSSGASRRRRRRRLGSA